MPSDPLGVSGRSAVSGKALRLLGGVLLVVSVIACDGGLVLPTAPSAGGSSAGGSLAGTWTGWFSSVTTGNKTVTVTIFQIGSVVTGFWTMFDFDDSSMSGNLTGGLVGSTAVLTLRPTNLGACSMSVAARVAGATLEGGWSMIECETEDVGTFRLSRQ